MSEIRKPALGCVADSRLTAEFIASDPRFAGVTPFDPAVDVDIVDEMNRVVAEALQMTPLLKDEIPTRPGLLRKAAYDYYFIEGIPT